MMLEGPRHRRVQPRIVPRRTQATDGKDAQTEATIKCRLGEPDICAIATPEPKRTIPGGRDKTRSIDSKHTIMRKIAQVKTRRADGIPGIRHCEGALVNRRPIRSTDNNTLCLAFRWLRTVRSDCTVSTLREMPILNFDDAIISGIKREPSVWRQIAVTRHPAKIPGGEFEHYLTCYYSDITIYLSLQSREAYVRKSQLFQAPHIEY